MTRSKIPDMTGSNFPDPADRKTRRRTQAIAKRYAFHANTINTKMWKYGIEFVVKLLPCFRYFVFSNCQTNLYSLLVVLSDPVPRCSIVYWVSILKQELYIALELQELTYQETPKIDYFWVHCQQVLRHNLYNIPYKANIWPTETK